MAPSTALSVPLIPGSTVLSPFSFLRRAPRFYLLLLLATLSLMLGLTALLSLTLSAPSASSAHLPTAPPAPTPQPAPAAGPPTTSALVTLETYPHDSDCFTQGLEWHADTLYESCGMYAQSSVRTVALDSGAVLSQRKLDGRYFAEGLTVRDGRVYQLTWRERDVFVYSPNLTLLRTERIETDGWGIAHTGAHIVTTDGSAWLYFRDPDTLQLLHKRRVVRALDGGAEVEVAQLNELEWAGGRLYANVWMQPVVLCIDADSGRVTHVWDASAQWRDAGGDSSNKVVNGLAYRPAADDGGQGRWYMTGKYWPKLYEVNMTLP